MSLSALLAVRVPSGYVQKRVAQRRMERRLRAELAEPHVPKQVSKRADHEQFRLTAEGARV